MSMLLKDKICCVTGASKGIGKATALRFAAEGATVYAIARDAAPIQKWVDENEFAGTVVPCQLDITDTAGVKALLMRIKKECGRLDVLVNNAAVERNERIGMITSQSMRNMFEVNVFALIETLQLAARIMQGKRSGSIINITSKVAQRGNPGQLVYSATKGAVLSLTKSAAKELAPYGIRVNAVAPGLTNTEMMAQADPAKLEERIRNICMGRLAEPEDIAAALVFFASDLSAYVSGQVLGVDGCTIL